MIVPNLHLLTVEAAAVAREARPGQFVILRAEQDGERIPLSLSDWDEAAGTISVIVMNVGSTTGRLAALAAGDDVPTVSVRSAIRRRSTPTERSSAWPGATASAASTRSHAR